MRGQTQPPHEMALPERAFSFVSYGHHKKLLRNAGLLRSPAIKVMAGLRVDQYRPRNLGTNVVREGKGVITARASRAAPISGNASLLICSMVRPLILAPT